LATIRRQPGHFFSGVRLSSYSFAEVGGLR
jgi:hypothetical protein